MKGYTKTGFRVSDKAIQDYTAEEWQRMINRYEISYGNYSRGKTRFWYRKKKQRRGIHLNDYAKQSYIHRTGEKKKGYGCLVIITLVMIYQTTMYFRYDYPPVSLAWEGGPQNPIQIEKIIEEEKPEMVVTATEPIKVAVNTPQEATRATGDEITDAIYENFDDRAEDAIKMLKTCENKGLRADIVSPKNRDGTVDVGLFQINVHSSNTEEIEKLKDYKYNIERAMHKYRLKNNTFYYWTCGDVVGDYTYVDYLAGR